MSDPTPTDGQPDNSAVTTPPKPVESDTDWKAEARKWEARAKENRDAKDKLDALEESQKSEATKLTERAEKAERDLEAARLDRDRAQVALSKGLNPDLAPLLSGASKEEIEKQADILAGLASKPSGSKPITSLKSGAAGSDSGGLSGKARAAEAVRQLRGVDH